MEKSEVRILGFVASDNRDKVDSQSKKICSAQVALVQPGQIRNSYFFFFTFLAQVVYLTNMCQSHHFLFKI